MLRIKCDGPDMGAEVSINGKFRGECPLDISVKPGTVQVRAVKAIDAARERVFEQTLRMGEDSAKSLEVVLTERLTAAGQKLEETKRAACPLCPDMVTIPSGNFQMGSNDGDSDQKPTHSVSIKSFAMGKTEVTQALWTAVMGSNPSQYSQCGPNCPVERVSWEDIQKFLQKLNALSGMRFRLPSEAEWEYAARAGTSSKYWWGDTASHEYANYGTDNLTGGLAQGRDQWVKTAPVGQFPPNAFGLYDMHGNVWEWVEDWYHDSYNGAPTDGSAWVNGGKQKERVLRGGDWAGPPDDLRSATRFGETPGIRGIGNGFRLARTLP